MAEAPLVPPNKFVYLLSNGTSVSGSPYVAAVVMIPSPQAQQLIREP
jgi:hypothetical protein